MGEEGISTGYQKQDVEFIAAIYGSIARGDGVELAIAQYAKHFPDIRFSWQAMCVSTNEHFARGAYNYDDGIYAEYPEVAHLNHIPGIASRYPIDSIVRSDFFLPKPQYERTDIYNLVFRQRDRLNSSLGAWAHREGNDAAFLGVDVPDRYQGAERQALIDSLTAILPHLQSAFTLMMELEVRRSRLGGGFWLETLPVAGLLVSADGYVGAANTAADALFSGTSGLSLGMKGQLGYGSNDQRDAIEKPLRRALTTLEPEGPFAILAPSGYRLSGYVVPLPPETPRDPVLALIRARNREALLVIVDLEEPVGAPPEILTTTLGITPAEARLVARLCEGGDVRDAAELLGISYNTARSQLASATGKLDLSRQTELIARSVRALTQLRGPAFRRGS